MKLAALLPLTAICVAWVVTCAGQDTKQAGDRVQGWSSDIDFLLKAIQRKHYVYRAKPLPEATPKVADELKSALGTMSDERVVAELLRLMATLGDGHCYVAPSP